MHIVKHVPKKYYGTKNITIISNNVICKKKKRNIKKSILIKSVLIILYIM